MLNKFIIFIFLLSPLAWAAEEEGVEGSVLCERTDDTMALDPKYDDADPCHANAKVQGISYECGKLEDVRWKVPEFLHGLQSSAKKKCEEFCQKQGSGCTADFDEPSECGFTVPQNKALIVGRQTPCGLHCKGQALIYCSIYHAGYIQMRDDVVKDQTPNCRCRKK